ncbi:MAG: ABC transporter ATP-binding protein [Eubacteriales bacterium]|nr:ABC transporter ATP-binding protein [Eubacteriales bacterium]MDD4133884.1 ABC transporter ATP-binding protein [Eubacteriales bacterium]
MIQAEHITRRYGAFEALKDLTFSVNIGEVAGLLGQNGAGKTTALHVLSGYLAPSAGSVRINGIDLAKRPGEAKRHIGYLPESIPLYPEMTPLEYLRFCCEIKRVHRQDRERHIQEIMELTDITQIRSQLSGTLSKGYRQRLGLAQALCGNPEALFLDEPTAGFDPVQSSAFRKLIRRLAKKHAIILSSHLLSEVKEVCDRILVLASGQLVLDRAARDGSDRQSRFRLVVAAPASLVLPPLRQLPGVRRAEAMGRGSPEMTTLFIETSKDSAFQHALSKLLCGLSVTTMELSPLGNSLEDLFLRVSSGQVPEENP